MELLDPLLDSWDRNNRITVNLLRAIPVEGLAVRSTPGGHTIAQLFMHLAYNRLAFIEENVPESGVKATAEEWVDENDHGKIERFLDDTSQKVREVARKQLETGTPMAMHYDHPLLFLQHMIWHDGYHHGQIKLALVVAQLRQVVMRVAVGTKLDPHISHLPHLIQGQHLQRSRGRIINPMNFRVRPQQRLRNEKDGARKFVAQKNR